MNDIQIFNNKELNIGVRTIAYNDGSISINVEDAAIGFGWTEVKDGKTYVMWRRVNQFIKEFDSSAQVSKDDYIPESLFYLLGMKANNDVAQKFQKWLAVDVIPNIRKTGTYQIPKLSKELQAIFVLDEKTVEIDNRVSKLENTMTIDYSQQEELRTLANKKTVAILGGKDTPAYKELNKKAFSQIWKDFKRIVQVNSYKNTSVKELDFARKVIIDWQPNRELELMIKGCNAQIRM